MPPNPTLADQVSRLYDLVAGYHATHMLEIARELGVQRNVVRTWVDRYGEAGLAGLQDRPRSGRPRTFSP